MARNAVKVAVCLAALIAGVLAWTPSWARASEQPKTFKHVQRVKLRLMDFVFLYVRPVPAGWVWVSHSDLDEESLRFFQVDRGVEEGKGRVVLDAPLPEFMPGGMRVVPSVVSIATPDQAALLLSEYSCTTLTFEGDVKLGRTVPCTVGSLEGLPVDNRRVLLSDAFTSSLRFVPVLFDIETGVVTKVTPVGWSEKPTISKVGASNGTDLWLIDSAKLGARLSKCRIVEHHSLWETLTGRATADLVFEKSMRVPRYADSKREHLIRHEATYLFRDGNVTWLSRDNVLYEVKEDLALVKTYDCSDLRVAVLVPSGDDLLILYNDSPVRKKSAESTGGGK